MSTSIQPREANGQFGTIERIEDDTVGLSEAGRLELSDEEYNADCTYAFPPKPRSADQHLAFWMRAKIPDSVLRQIQDVFRFKKAQQITDFELRDGINEWRALSGHQRRELAARGIRTQDQYIEMRIPEVEAAQAPNWITSSDVRWVVRAYKAATTAGRLPREEQLKVLSFRVPMADGDQTVNDVWLNHNFKAMDMQNSLIDPADDVREAIERLRISMENMG